jgi:hypothetical protein
VVALAVRALAAAVHPDPAYPDSFYYVNVARTLAAGNGFSIDYVWNFVDVGGRLPPSPGLPIPSNAHWMPLAQLVQLPSIALLGPTPVAYGLPFWLLGAAVAPLTYWIGRDAGLEKWAAFCAGLLVAVPLGATPFLAQPDNFAPFMLLGALALWLCGRALSGRGDARFLYGLGGVVVGLATLSRNDGVLLGIPFALAFLAEQAAVLRGRRGAVRVRDGRQPVAERIGWTAALLCLAGFLVVIAPWYARQLAIFGSISPSAANGRILWITDYDQLFSISTESTLASFLAQGPLQLAASRIQGLLDAVKWFLVAPLLVFLAPFLVAGSWVKRSEPLFRPWFVYAVALFAFSALLFAVHVDHGTFLHSAVALMPHAYVLSVVGIATAVRWVARRRPHWDPPRATRNFTILAVVVAVIGAAGATWRVSGAWAAERTLRQPLFAALSARPPSERVMSPDPGAYRYHAGKAGIVTPNDPLPVVEQALRGYGIRWLVVERDYLLPAYVPLLTGQSRPAWLSGPVVVVTDDPGARPAALDPAVAGAPRAALYAVCLEPGDDRCR